MKSSEDVIDLYLKLVHQQIQEFINSRNESVLTYAIYYLGGKDSTLAEIDKKSLGYRYRLLRLELSKDAISQLIERGLLLKLGHVDGVEVYTTLHADIVFRVLRGRAYSDNLDGRWVGFFDISVKSEHLPSYDARSVEELRDVLYAFFYNGLKDDKLSSKLVDVVLRGIARSGYQKIAEWQYKSIREILAGLSSPGRRKHYVIMAPTAAGKTLVFMFVATSYALLQKALASSEKTSRKTSQQNTAKVLLVYPRRALQHQQLERLLQLIHFINDEIRSSGLVDKMGLITIGIDMGVSQSDSGEQRVETKIKCPQQAGQRHGEPSYLVIVKESSKRSRIVCSDGTELDYVVGIVMTQQDRERIAESNPDILISNPWTIKSRILSPDDKLREFYLKRGLVVLDEAHVYTNVRFIEHVASLRLLNRIRELNEKITTFIASSATVYLRDGRDLLRWMLDAKLEDVDALSYHELEPEEGRKKRMKILVTLFPYRLTQETLLQGILQILGLLATNDKVKAKSLVFVDSIGEASTIMGYLETIFKVREAVEICDHISTKRCKENEDQVLSTRQSITLSEDYDDYSWSHYYKPKSNTVKIKDLLADLKKAYDYISIHHGALEEHVRRVIEEEFAKGQKKILISTSTLDLGMDYNDVTFIVQYKDPINDEALEQRMGRAGRSDEAARISLCFYLPTVTPTAIQRLLTKGSGGSETLLPDETNARINYLSQALEYEILLHYSSLVKNSMRRDKVVDNIWYNVLRPTLSCESMDDFIRRWCPQLGNDEVRKLSSWLCLPLDHIQPPFRSSQEATGNPWRSLRTLLTRKINVKEEQICQEVYKQISQVPKIVDKHGITKDKVKNILKKSKVGSRAWDSYKQYLEELARAVEYCESIADLRLGIEIAADHMNRCVEKLKKLIEEMAGGIKFSKSMGIYTLNMIKQEGLLNTHETELAIAELAVRGILVKELEQLRNELEKIVNDLGAGLSLNKSVWEYLYSSLIEEVRVSGKSPECRKRYMSSTLFWYDCVKPELSRILFSSKASPLFYREEDHVHLEIYT